MRLTQQPAVPSRALQTLGHDVGKIKVGHPELILRHLKEFSMGDATLRPLLSTVNVLVSFFQESNVFFFFFLLPVPVSQQTKGTYSHLSAL